MDVYAFPKDSINAYEPSDDQLREMIVEGRGLRKKAGIFYSIGQFIKVGFGLSKLESIAD